MTYVNVLVHVLCLFSGIGVSMVYAPSIAIVGLYFKDRFNLAAAMASIGNCVGAMIFPQIIGFLISFYGWRGAVLILGAINCHIVASVCLYRPLKKLEPTRKGNVTKSSEALEVKENKSAKEESGQRLRSICKATAKATGIPKLCMKPHFPIVLFSAFVSGITIYCPIIYIAPRVMQHNYSKSQAAILLSLFGVGQILARVIQGLVFGFKYLSTHTVYFLSMLIGAVALFTFGFMSNFGVLGVVAVILGITTGIVVTSMYVVASDVAPKRLLGPVIGYVVFMSGIGNTLGTVLGGKQQELSFRIPH